MEPREILASLRDRPHLWWHNEGRLRHANGLTLWVGSGCLYVGPVWGGPVSCCMFGLIDRWRIWRAFRRWQRWEAIYRLGPVKEGDRV